MAGSFEHSVERLGDALTDRATVFPYWAILI